MIDVFLEQFLTRASSQMPVECRDAGFGSATMQMILLKNSSKHFSSQYGLIVSLLISLLSTSYPNTVDTMLCAMAILNVGSFV